MSGLEVAGLVLGVLPIAVKTLQTYKKALSSYKNAVRFIHALETDLTNEHCILTCTCESLLQGIAPTSKVDIMLKDPFGHEWKEEQFNRALRLRLGQSYPSIESGIQDLKELVDELVTKLGLGSDLKSSLVTIEDIWSEIKKKTAFTLKKEDYDTILTKIKSANSRLYVLVGLNKGLEPRRQHRSQWRFTQLLRDLSQSLFNALDGATAACCARPHDVCLKLNPRPLQMDHGSTEDDVAKDLDFTVSLELYRNGPMPAGPSSEPSRWYSLSVSIVNLGSRKAGDYLPRTLNLRSSQKAPAGHLPQTKGQLTAAKGTAEGPNKRRSQRLLGNIVRSITGKGKATTALIQGSMDSIIELNPKPVACLKTSTPSSVLGLCQLIRRHEKYSVTEHGRLFYGKIMDLQDPERMFGLYAPTLLEAQHQTQTPPILRWRPSDLPPTLTLRQLLDPTSDTYPHPGSNVRLLFLEFQDKLQLAVIIAINTLHLYSSHWLPKIITLDDILFRLEDEVPSSSPYCFHSDFQPGFPYRPFIQKSRPLSASSAMLKTHTAMPRSRRREITVFSFGLILIQIMLERVINELDMKSTLNGQGDAAPAAEQSDNSNNSTTTASNIAATMSMEQYMTKFRLGSELNDDAVLQEAGEEYSLAVTWCLKSFINIGGLQDERFCQDFYVNVISMLQDALDKSMGR